MSVGRHEPGVGKRVQEMERGGAQFAGPAGSGIVGWNLSRKAQRSARAKILQSLAYLKARSNECGELGGWRGKVPSRYFTNGEVRS